MLKDPNRDIPSGEANSCTHEDAMVKQAGRTESEKRVGTTSPTIQDSSEDNCSEELPSFESDQITEMPLASFGADQITEILSRGGDLTGSLILGENPDDVSLGPSLISFVDEHPISRAHSSLMSSFLTEPGISMISTMKGDDDNSQALEPETQLNSFGTSLVSFADDGVDSFGASLVSFAEADSSDEGSDGVSPHAVGKTTYRNVYGKGKKAVSFAESEYSEMNSYSSKQIPRKELEQSRMSRMKDPSVDASYEMRDNANTTDINSTKIDTMQRWDARRKYSINRNVPRKTEFSTGVVEEQCVGDKVEIPNGDGHLSHDDEHSARDIIVGCTSNVSQYTTASHATTPRCNASYFLRTESEELAERCDTVSDINGGAKFRALQTDLIVGCDMASNMNSRAKFRALKAITDAFGNDHIIDSQVRRDTEEYEMPVTQLDTNIMNVTNTSKISGVVSDGVDSDTREVDRENPFEDDSYLADVKSLPPCASHTEQNTTDSQNRSHLTSFDIFPVTTHNIADQQAVRHIRVQPINSRNASVMVATHNDIREIKSLFTESTDDRLGSISSSSMWSSISISKAEHPEVAKISKTEDADYNLKRLIIFSVITLFGGFYGSFYAQTSCHFATISHNVGYYSSDFKSHIGMWQYSPINSIFSGSSYCASYGNSGTLNSPSSVRIIGLLALLCGTFTMVIIWCYLFFVRTTELLWTIAWHMALLAGLLQACTLLFFFESVCQINSCGIGPGAVASIIASLSWFSIVYGMTRTVPSDAVIKPMFKGVSLSILKDPKTTTVEMAPISRSNAGKIDPRTSMYQAPVFADDYALV